MLFAELGKKYKQSDCESIDSIYAKVTDGACFKEVFRTAPLTDVVYFRTLNRLLNLKGSLPDSLWSLLLCHTEAFSKNAVKEVQSMFRFRASQLKDKGQMSDYLKFLRETVAPRRKGWQIAMTELWINVNSVIIEDQDSWRLCMPNEIEWDLNAKGSVVVSAILSGLFLKRFPAEFWKIINHLHDQRPSVLIERSFVDSLSSFLRGSNFQIELPDASFGDLRDTFVSYLCGGLKIINRLYGKPNKTVPLVSLDDSLDMKKHLMFQVYPVTGLRGDDLKQIITVAFGECDRDFQSSFIKYFESFYLKAVLLDKSIFEWLQTHLKFLLGSRNELHRYLLMENGL